MHPVFHSFAARVAVALSALVLPAFPAPRPEMRPALPVWFEPAPNSEVFHSRGTAGGYTIDSRGVWLQVRGEDDDRLLRLRLVESRTLFLEGEDKLNGVTYRFTGQDKRRWTQGIPQFARVRARQVYDGIDVVYYAAGNQLEYDFVLRPEADPSQIALRLEGAEPPSITAAGALAVRAGSVEVLHHRPVAYQLNNGVRQPVEVRYLVDDGGRISFALGEYDRSRELVIDPVFGFSGYFGGETLEVINAVAAAPDGTFWIAGQAASEIAPPEGSEAFQSQRKEFGDAFLAQLRKETDGSYTVQHFTYVGGSAEDEVTAIAVDAAGVVYAAGRTLSFDFPLGGDAFQTSRSEESEDAFALRYDIRQGGALNLTYSSYYGSSGLERAVAVAVDANGRFAIAGSTDSGTLPAATSTPLQPSNRGGIDAFLAVFNPNAGSASATLAVSTFFGGNGSDSIEGLQFNSQGKLVAGGRTTSSDLPIAGAVYQAEQRGLGDGLLAIFDPGQSGFDQLLYGGYFGGDGLDAITAIALDSAGSLWVTGYTQSQQFPTTPASYRPTPAGSTDAFVAKLDLSQPPEAVVQYSSYFGGTRTDVAYSIAVASPFRATIAGYTNSTDLPFTNIAGSPGYPPVQLTEMFMATFDLRQPASGSLDSALVFGGAKTDVATGVATSAAGDILVVGYTDSYGLNGIGDDIPGKRNGAGIPTGFFFSVTP